jgi:hypothetical protein
VSGILTTIGAEIDGPFIQDQSCYTEPNIGGVPRNPCDLLPSESNVIVQYLAAAFGQIGHTRCALEHPSGDANASHGL